MVRDAVAEVEGHAAAMRGCDFRQQDTLIVENSVLTRRVNMRDDVTALEQRQKRAQRRIILAYMDHDRQIEGRCDLLRPAQGFEIVGARDVVREASLDADDNIPIALDRRLGHRHVRRVDVVQFAGRRDHTGPRDIDEAAAGLRRTARNRRHRVDIVRPAGAGIDPAGHTVLKAHRRTFLAAPGMGVDVSIRPAVTTLPRASMVAAASAAMLASTATILSPEIATSRIASRPIEGSITRPPLMTRSYVAANALGIPARNAAPAVPTK